MDVSSFTEEIPDAVWNNIDNYRDMWRELVAEAGFPRTLGPVAPQAALVVSDEEPEPAMEGSDEDE